MITRRIRLYNKTIGSVERESIDDSVVDAGICTALYNPISDKIEYIYVDYTVLEAGDIYDMKRTLSAYNQNLKVTDLLGKIYVHNVGEGAERVTRKIRTREELDELKAELVSRKEGCN